MSLPPHKWHMICLARRRDLGFGRMLASVRRWCLDHWECQGADRRRVGILHFLTVGFLKQAWFLLATSLLDGNGKFASARPDSHFFFAASIRE